MGLKGKIKGSYLYTQWKLGKYTKRRVKHSVMDNYNNYYEEEENTNTNYPDKTNKSYSYYPPEKDNKNYQYSQNYSNDDVNNHYTQPGTYNRMAYYPTMDEN